MSGFPMPEHPAPPPLARPTAAARPLPTYVGRRPESIGAVAALSVTCAIFGILMAVVLVVLAAGLLWASADANQQIKTFAPDAMPVSRPTDPTLLQITPAPAETGPNGMAEGPRAVVIAQFRRIVEIAPPQEQQLDALLRDAGGQIFPRFDPGNDSAVSDALSDHGLMPSASPSQRSPIYFVTAGGRTQIYDDRAVFYPARGSLTIRSAAGPRLNSTGHPVLRIEDVDALMGLIRQACGNKISGPQVATLEKLLTDHDQQLVALNGERDAATIGIKGAGPQRGGFLLVGFAGGPLLLSPAGQPIFSGDSLPAVSNIACLGVIVLVLVGLSLSIWLILISRRLSRQTLLSPRLHRRWAMGRIATSIAMGVFLGWMLGSFIASRPGADPANPAGIIAGVAVAAAGCVFPIVALLLLRRPAARLYFDGVM